MSENLKSGDGN